MKKYLLGTAATLLVLGVSGLTIDSANAGADPKGVAPTLKISGNATGTFHWYENSKNARGEKGYGTVFALEDSRLNFQATGRMAEGWTGESFYDWLIGFTGDTAEEQNVEENRIRVKGYWGTGMVGNTQGVENFMARGAFGVMGGTGGFDGNFKMTTTRATGLLLTTDMVGATKYATKGTYVTPRFAGFQAGVSYTPNSEHKGEGTNGDPHVKTSRKTPKETFDNNSWAFGANYINKFPGDFSLALSATAVVGHTRPPAGKAIDQTNLFTAHQTAPRNRTKSFALGGVASYQDFELGMEWIDNGKSQQIKNANRALGPGRALTTGTPNGQATENAGGVPVVDQFGNPVTTPVPTTYTGRIGSFNAGKTFSVATAYSFGFNKVSYGYYYSCRKFNGANTIGNVHSLAYDRAVAPGFSVFAEGVLFDFKSKQSSVAFQNALKANTPGNALSSGVLSNNGRTLLMGASTKF